MGESWRVHNVGLSSLDLLDKDFFKSKSYLEKSLILILKNL